MRSFTSPKVAASFVVMVAAWVVLTSCAPAARDADAQSRYVFDHLKARAGSVSSVNYDRELADWLPNQQFRNEGSEPRTLGTGIVVGDITDAKPGRAYAVDGDAETGTEVPYGSREALWRTVDVTVAIESAWGSADGSDQVRFGLSINGTEDPDKIMSGLESMDSAIVVLAPPGFFKYDDSLFSVGRSGTLLGVVKDGSISFPALDAEEARNFLSDTPTVAALENQSEETPPDIVITDGVRQ